MLISVDLMYEWLVMAREKMMAAEYAVCLLTFFAIQWVGVELGMAMGIVFAMIAFVVTYAKVPSVSSTSLQQSRVVRTYEERALLIKNRGE